MRSGTRVQLHARPHCQDSVISYLNHPGQILCRYNANIGSCLAVRRKKMTERSDGTNEPSLSKRRRSTYNIASKAQSLAQGRSTAAKADLLRWLDQADKQDEPVSNVFNSPPRKGVRSSPDVYECVLDLNGKNYHETHYIVERMEKWLSMAKYRKLYISDVANSSGPH